MSGGDFQWLVSQYLSAQSHDLEVTVPGDKANRSTLAVFPAHTLVLSSQSSVLAAILDKAQQVPGKIKRIVFKAIYTPRSVEYFLRFLYTKSIPKKIPFLNITELLHMSDVYEVDELLTECNQRIINNLSIDTVCELYEIAALRSLTELQEACRIFIRNNKQTILTNDLHFGLQSERNLIKVFAENSSKTVVKTEFDWNKKTKDGEVQLKAMLRYRNWLSCFRSKDVKRSESFTKALELKEVDRESCLYMNDFDQNNWIPDLYMDTTLCDVKLVVDGGEARFPAHSLVLNKQSEVLLSMWNEIKSRSDMNKVVVLEIELKELTARVAEHMLRYLYTRFLPTEISDSILMDLLNASHRFEIQSLESKCTSLLIKRITLLNCCEMYELAERLDNRTLALVSLTRIQENLVKVLKNHLHFALNKESLVRVLTRMNMTGLIKEWGKWRCCLLGVKPDDSNLAEMIESLLAESAYKTQLRKSVEVVPVSNTTIARFLSFRKSDPTSSKSNEGFKEGASSSVVKNDDVSSNTKNHHEAANGKPTVAEVVAVKNVESEMVKKDEICLDQGETFVRKESITSQV